MKSIQTFLKQSFLLFALGLITLGIVSVGIYSFHTYHASEKRLDEVNYRVSIQLDSGVRNALNNLQVAESLMLSQIKKKSIDKETTGTTLASIINYNPTQFDIWFAIDQKVVQTMEGHPPGIMFLVVRNADKYLPETYDPMMLDAVFSLDDYKITQYNHAVYYQDLKLKWYQRPLKNKNRLTYVSAYFDEIYTQRWLFTLAKAIRNKSGELQGVVGIDYGLDMVQGVLAKFTGKLGLIVIEDENNKVLFEISAQDHALTSTSHPNSELSPESLKQYATTGELVHKKINGKWVVFKVFKSGKLSWSILVYNTAWSFYYAIIPFVLILAGLVFIFSTSVLYFMNKQKKHLLNPLNDLLTALKRDSSIVGTSKNISGHYQTSRVIELNELIDCINKLFEVVNENFDNYRTELDKNIKSKEDLEILVEKRSEQLVEREKLASLGFMSAGLAHEIKNPLNLICNASEIIALQLSKMDKTGIVLSEAGAKAFQRISESNSIILNNGQRVDNIVKTLLMQVRSRQEGHEHSIDIGKLINHNLDFVLSSCRPKLNNRIELIVDFPEKEIYLKGNPVDLGRMFINLFDNSCYAMIKKINSDSNFTARLKVQMEEKALGVEITILDNGIGISKTQLTQIFTPFFTTKPPGEGSGLGLNFVYEIVKQHKGKIEVNSEESVSTKFNIFLPFEG
jgi:signal transduction histidine kinase